jgi:hypothetical protein
MKSLIILLLISTSIQAHAWGRRGHAAVNSIAARLIAELGLDASQIGKDRAFDLSYFANVPDLIWKKSETYNKEWTEHFMDMEFFDRGIKDVPVAKALALDRAEFDKKYPQVEIKAGRSFWRIREFLKRLDSTANELKKADLTKEKKQELQNDWLTAAGLMGHYVGDLSMPLHVTENHDGQMTDQKGVHSFFEDLTVNEYDPGEIENAAYKKAKSLEKSLKLSGKEPLDLLIQLTDESRKNIPELLKIDKKIGRDLTKAKSAYKQMIINRIASASVYLAELWSRSLAWKYDGDKFFNFTPAPTYIDPGK